MLRGKKAGFGWVLLSGCIVFWLLRAIQPGKARHKVVRTIEIVENDNSAGGVEGHETATREQRSFQKKGGMMRGCSKIFQTVIIILVALPLVSCGTILYPERRNQDVGRIDAGVALLDGFWLLVGIVPGVIAFAVDFSTGAIYLPKSKLGKLDFKNYRTVRFNPETTTPAEVEKIISRETGYDFTFADENLELTKIMEGEQLPEYLMASNR